MHALQIALICIHLLTASTESHCNPQSNKAFEELCLSQSEHVQADSPGLIAVTGAPDVHHEDSYEDEQVVEQDGYDEDDPLDTDESDEDSESESSFDSSVTSKSSQVVQLGCHHHHLPPHLDKMIIS